MRAITEKGLEAVGSTSRPREGMTNGAGLTNGAPRHPPGRRTGLGTATFRGRARVREGLVASARRAPGPGRPLRKLRVVLGAPSRPREADPGVGAINQLGAALTAGGGSVNGAGLTRGGRAWDDLATLNGSALTRGREGAGTNGSKVATTAASVATSVPVARGLEGRDGMTNGSGLTASAAIVAEGGMTNGSGLTHGEALTNGCGLVRGPGVLMAVSQVRPRPAPTLEGCLRSARRARRLRLAAAPVAACVVVGLLLLAMGATRPSTGGGGDATATSDEVGAGHVTVLVTGPAGTSALALTATAKGQEGLLDRVSFGTEGPVDPDGGRATLLLDMDGDGAPSKGDVPLAVGRLGPDAREHGLRVSPPLRLPPGEPTALLVLLEGCPAGSGAQLVSLGSSLPVSTLDG